MTKKQKIMPRKKSATMAATVGTTHLRSLGLSAGRKKAMISQMMIGQQIITEKNRATLNRMVKPPSAVRTVSWPPRIASRIWSIIISMRVGVAK